MITKYKTICISDLHLGTRDCKSQILNNFLKNHECENLFLLGDILDLWQIKQNKWRWNSNDTEVVRSILKYSKYANVEYILGNHDEELRKWIDESSNFANIKIKNQSEYLAIDGVNYLLTHGDLFDGISSIAPQLTLLGDKAYNLALWLNNHYNYIRHQLGFGYWSLSAYLKNKVKGAVNFIFKFEDNITTYAKKRGYGGVICGHIHQAEIKVVNSIIYMNDGDFVDSCTALVEDYNGMWKIIHWNTIK